MTSCVCFVYTTQAKLIPWISVLASSSTLSSKADPRMSETHLDEYEHYNFDVDKHVNSGHSGKQRTKKEASEHTNHFDPSGHSRKITTKLQNMEQNNKKTENAAKGSPVTKS